MVVVGFFTGMRWCELSALVWSDLDEVQGRIIVSKSQFKGNISTTKTDSARTVPLVGLLSSVLSEHRLSMNEARVPTGPSDLVFPSKRGTCRKPSVLRKPFDQVLKEMELTRRFTPHGMRRTFNNIMRQTVEDGVLVRSMTGHVDERMTTHYSSVGTPEKQRALQKLFERVGMTLETDATEGVREPERNDEVVYQVVYRPEAA